MPKQKPNKVIIDTNIWISFLIGKELQYFKDLITSNKIKIVITDQLLDEIRLVTSRPKLKKYFDQDKVSDLIVLLEIISDKVKLKKIERICRDPKDDFLLALAKQSKANYLITGDKDLLTLKTHGQAYIVSPKDFDEKFGQD